MGWTSFHKDNGTSTRETLERELFGGRTFGSVVGHSQKGSTHFFAVKYKVDDSNRGGFSNNFEIADDSITLALIVLTRTDNKDKYNFSYKDMDESAGPYEPCLSETFLALLSPLKPDAGSFAKEWRERCRVALATARKAEGLKIGNRIRLPEPVKFGDGKSRQVFEVAELTRRGRRQRVYLGEDGIYCRLSKEQVAKGDIQCGA